MATLENRVHLVEKFHLTPKLSIVGTVDTAELFPSAQHSPDWQQ
jgi:hypothetical protein